MIAEIRDLDRPVGVLMAVLCGLLVGILAYVLIYHIPLVGYDFEAFWCGGRALLLHASPYLNEPLHSCEVAASPGFFQHYPQVTIPAPLPPYALALFTPLSLLPFAVARDVWWILQFVSTAAIAYGISKITGMPSLTAVAASALAVLAPTLLQCALAPIPIALVVLGALALGRRQWTLSAVCLGFATIEPHMVLPACIAVFLFVPQMRLRLIAAGICAAALTIVAVGKNGALAYFTTVLPQHAASEYNNLGQESLTAILYHLGIGAELALRIGSLQYALLAVFGLFIARRLYKNTGEYAWLVLLPAAFAVIGGSFIHLGEVAMVVPLACLVAMRRPGPAAYAVLVMLALPIESIAVWLPFAVPAAMIVAWFTDRPEFGMKRYAANGMLPALAAVAIFIVARIWNVLGNANVQQSLKVTTHFANPAASASASAAWAQYNALATLTPMWWPEKIWLFVPLLLLVWLCVRPFSSVRSASGTPVRLDRPASDTP